MKVQFSLRMLVIAIILLGAMMGGGFYAHGKYTDYRTRQRIRAEMCESLARMPVATRAIIERMRDDYEGCFHFLCRELGTPSDWVYRGCLIGGLALYAERGKPCIERYLEDPDPNVRESARRALKMIDESVEKTSQRPRSAPAP